MPIVAQIERENATDEFGVLVVGAADGFSEGGDLLADGGVELPRTDRRERETAGLVSAGLTFAP